MPTLADNFTCTDAELAHLRDLAKRLKTASEEPIQAKRIELWKQHNDLEQVRPILYFSPEGSWDEIIPADSLVCEHKHMRQWERMIRMVLYQNEHFADDIPVEAKLPIWKNISHTSWGLEPKKVPSAIEKGAWTFDPVIFSMDDAKKLTTPTVIYNEEDSLRRYNAAQEAIGDIIDIQLTGKQHISFHLMQQLTLFRGMDMVFMDMYDNPDLLHECLERFTVGHQGILQQWLDMDLIDFNNDNGYQGSGGRSWTNQLPKPGFDPKKPRLCDLWASAEDQELAVVGPEHHKEFAFDYVKRLLEPFGLTAYGCCENLTEKMDMVLKLPHIRRISVSPWADVKACCEKLGRKAIVSWKPHPAHIAVDWKPDAVRQYLREGLTACKEANAQMEIIVKDTHTCCNEPWRFDRFSAIAKEEMAEVGFDVETWPFAQAELAEV